MALTPLVEEMGLYGHLAKKLGTSLAQAKAWAEDIANKSPDFSKLKSFEEVNQFFDKEADKENTLTHLGSKNTTYKYSESDEKLLERFPNPMQTGSEEDLSSIQIVAPEFTSICPITGQPDFATIVVEYSPHRWCVESKSFKLYLGSFRQMGEFHEACVKKIFADLKELLDPVSLMVEGQFTPRGGIKFWPKIRTFR